MSANRPASAMVIDLDGVLRHWLRLWNRATEPRTHRVEDAVFAVAFAPERLARAITGVIAHDAWLLETIAVLSEDWPVDDACRAVTVWAESVPMIDRVVRGLVTKW